MQNRGDILHEFRRNIHEYRHDNHEYRPIFHEYHIDAFSISMIRSGHIVLRYFYDILRYLRYYDTYDTKILTIRMRDGERRFSPHFHRSPAFEFCL